MTPLIHPAYVMIDYVWAVLSANMGDVWDKTKYGGLTPIVPANDEPELSQYSGPRIVYEYAGYSGNPDSYITHNRMTFVVIGKSFRQITQTLNIMQAALERLDESARDIQNFAYRFNAGLYKEIGFTSVEVDIVSGATPAEQEGGTQVGMLGISFDTITEYNVITNV